jgi:hypothetical protein
MDNRAIVIGILSLTIVVGCGSAEEQTALPEDEWGAEETGETEQALLTTTLTITQTNKDKLSNACWIKQDSNNWLLQWTGCNGRSGGTDLDALHKTWTNVGGVTGTVLNDNFNTAGLLGECVSMVKALSKNNTTTPNWKPGVNVVSDNNVIAGTAIATFVNGSYQGHAGFFAGYMRDSYGAVLGIWLWDQNFGAKAVKEHRIYRTGQGTSDADNYYVVLVP